MDKFINIALKEAKKAFDEGNVPVGAVIVKNGKVVAKGYNKKNTSNISVYHAEILSIMAACRKLNSWYLNDCIMYVTLKPCKMCEAAIAESRIKKVIYLIDSNYCRVMNNNINNICYEKMNVKNSYSKILSDFFKMIR